MSPTPNPRVTFASIPSGYPVPGSTTLYEPDSHKIDLEHVELRPGQVLVKTLYLSVDPYMRYQMRDASIPGPLPALELGSAIAGSGVAVVLRSESSKFTAGDHLWTFTLPWTSYSTLEDAGLDAPLQNPANLPWSAFLGVAGMSALTAFYSLREFAKFQKDEVIFVSSAAGAIGSIVVQLAKLAGLKVIASVGDEAKVKYVKEELNADVVFNYKKADTREQLKTHGPVDIYFDNVGAATLDAALEFSNVGGRIIRCGSAAEYNTMGNGEPYGIKHSFNIIARSLTINGFMIDRLIGKLGLQPFVDEYLPLVADGKIKYLEHRSYGLEKIEAALVEVLEGGNLGKSINVVAEE